MFIELNYRMKWTISSALSITIKHFTLIISKEHPFAPPSLHCWYQMNGRGGKTHRWFFVCRRCITSIITKSPCAHNSPRPGLAGHQPHAGPTLASLIKLPRLKTLALLNAPISPHCICHRCCISHGCVSVSCPRAPMSAHHSVEAGHWLAGARPQLSLASLASPASAPGHCSPQPTYPPQQQPLVCSLTLTLHIRQSALLEQALWWALWDAQVLWKDK